MHSSRENRHAVFCKEGRSGPSVHQVNCWKSWIEDTIPEVYLLQALADEPLTDLRGCDLSERERVMEACRICMPQRRNRRHALSKVRHATSVQNRLVDQRRNVRQRIPRVKRTRRFPTGGQINADRVLGTPWHSVFTFPAGL